MTVAVTARRADELDILESIYRATEDDSFFPFRDKSRALDRADHIRVSENVIAANQHRVSAIAHVDLDGSDQQSVEAVQSAVLVKELDLENALVILDGDEQKAVDFGRAISGVSDARPPMTTCIQSELYYPASLLADLSASYLAYEIDDAEDCYDAEPTVLVDKDHRHWGPAYAKMRSSTDSVSVEPIEQRRAGTVSQRVNCWFDGTMGGGEPVQFGGSVQRIVNYAENEGYDELARWLSEI